MPPTAPRSPAAEIGIDPALAERFGADLAAVWPEAAGDGARLGIAVSGGPDSLALLLLAEASLPGRIEAATVDHQLRPESAQEARFVAELCAERAIPHAILPCTVAPGNMQDRARQARYTALEGWAREHGLTAVATAHHADDQAETMLMRLNRGSGIAGLAGIRASRPLSRHATLVRPLLDWRKSELEAVCDAARMEPVRDPTNEDPAYDRSRVRNLLRSASWIDPAGFATSARLIAESHEVLRAMVADAVADRLTIHGAKRIYFPSGSRTLETEVLRHILGEMGGKPSRSELARMVDRLFAGENASLAGILVRPSEEADHEGGGSLPAWHIAPEPARRTG